MDNFPSLQPKNTNIEEEEKSFLSRIAGNPKKILLLIRKLFGLLENKIDSMQRVTKITPQDAVNNRARDYSTKKSEREVQKPISNGSEYDLFEELADLRDNKPFIENKDSSKNIRTNSQKPNKESLDEEDLV